MKVYAHFEHIVAMLAHERRRFWPTLLGLSMQILSSCGSCSDMLFTQNFLGRLPIGFNVVILSPHGFFGQANVLGKPDTGGQVMASCTIP